MLCVNPFKKRKESPFEWSLEKTDSYSQPIQAEEHSKHLVKTISDLPVFVTIESYRVASYLIDGEPHLCLPQLLRFLRQNFPLDKVIDKLENTVTNFKSASPKQVEGFIKTSALPQDATSCPLIKRSDSEWICLALFDQYSKSKWNDDLCSISDLTTKNSLSREIATITTAATITISTASTTQASTTQFNDNLSKQNLFESQAQNSILNLVRVATSTLKIQIYHRCFGKCVGFYYPSLLKNSSSDCIECSSCRKILSPRRFLGHTHGTKEVNVCHWGFNSYHWRHYLRLSRKQPMNKLDDDELLVQFDLLKSTPDATNNQDINDIHEHRAYASTNETKDTRSMCPNFICTTNTERYERQAQPISNPTLTSSMTYLNLLDQLRDGQLNQLTDSAQAPSTSSASPSHLTPERLIKQDIFVSTRLTNYLNSKGYHPKITEDIVDHALDFISKSRVLF